MVPILKDTWLASPWKEDRRGITQASPSDPEWSAGGSQPRVNPDAAYNNPPISGHGYGGTNGGSGYDGYFIDSNTFGYSGGGHGGDGMDGNASTAIDITDTPDTHGTTHTTPRNLRRAVREVPLRRQPDAGLRRYRGKRLWYRKPSADPRHGDQWGRQLDRGDHQQHPHGLHREPRRGHARTR